MRVAIASSGLGHVTRGIETWAKDTAYGLAAQGVDTLLLHAGRGRLAPPRSGPRPAQRALACLRRGESGAVRLAGLAPSWSWRWGLNSAYGLEQLSFWARCWPVLRRRRIQILHVQDPLLARACWFFRRAGLVSTREILAHGTEEPPEFLAPLDFVQHLAPWHLEQTLAALPPPPARWAFGPGRAWRALPNFVDTQTFRPPEPGEKSRLRRGLGIPTGDLVVGVVAAVKDTHKRIGYLIDEAAEWLDQARAGRPARVVVAGAETGETPALRRKMADRLGERGTLYLDLPHERMPDLYRCLDLFVLPSLFEMMPISLLEALASGLPVVVNRHPVLEWISGRGQGGAVLDLSAPGVLAGFLCGLTAEWLEAKATGARDRAVNRFAKPLVISRYINYYQEVLNS
jgi:glycosyltransferase involved in cell wall biosynthesis